MTVRWYGKELEARVRRGAMRGVIEGTEIIRGEVISLILDTPKTGRVYRRRGIEHQASAPGEAPASDTGTLVSRVRTNLSRLSRLVGIVTSSAAHAADLEYGTQKMEPRPHMRSAVANRRDDVVAAVERGINEELRG